MLHWFRVRARSIAAAALVSLATLTITSATPHESDCHDSTCGSGAIPHDPSAHGIGRDTFSSERPLHCVLCHWTRIVRPSGESTQHIVLAVETTVRIPVDLACAPQTFCAAQPPLRAPPAALSLDV
jgi:hypothetical protein